MFKQTYLCYNKWELRYLSHICRSNGIRISQAGSTKIVDPSTQTHRGPPNSRLSLRAPAACGHAHCPVMKNLVWLQAAVRPSLREGRQVSKWKATAEKLKEVYGFLQYFNILFCYLLLLTEFLFPEAAPPSLLRGYWGRTVWRGELGSSAVSTAWLKCSSWEKRSGPHCHTAVPPADPVRNNLWRCNSPHCRTIKTETKGTSSVLVSTRYLWKQIQYQNLL